MMLPSHCFINLISTFPELCSGLALVAYWAPRQLRPSCGLKMASKTMASSLTSSSFPFEWRDLVNPARSLVALCLVQWNEPPAEDYDIAVNLMPRSYHDISLYENHLLLMAITLRHATPGCLRYPSLLPVNTFLNILYVL